MITTGSNEARKYFEDKGLTYADITSGEICALVLLLNKHLKIANRAGTTSVDMYMSEKISCNYKSNGTLAEGFLYINSHYFTQREAISFNKNGFIGFCGWADESNTSVIVGAFKEWCDSLSAGCMRSGIKVFVGGRGGKSFQAGFEAGYAKCKQDLANAQEHEITENPFCIAALAGKEE